MNPLNLNDVVDYAESNIGTFHNKKLESLKELTLDKILKRKNPYLFKAKYILTAEQLIRGILDAHLSSQEETMFGDFLEGIAVFVCERVYEGYKPYTDELTGIDLVFQKDGKVYIVEIKSGPNWGNSSQIKRMLTNFKNAIEKLQPDYPGKEIVGVNGCCYGKDRKPLKKKKDGTYYWKLCGQEFWDFISGNSQLYIEIIEPLGHKAKQKNEAFQKDYAEIINLLTFELGDRFYEGGKINWERLVKFVSEKPPPKKKARKKPLSD